MNVGWGDSGDNGLVSVEYTFKGESAHAAGAPWRGKSALDAVELMDIGWNFRREHLRLQQRSHYVIPNGGDQPNVVPPNAAVWYYFRETDYAHIKELWDIGDNMAKAAAMMTDTEVHSRVLGSAWPAHMNKTVAETMHANMEKVGLPTWSRGRSDAGERAAEGAQGARDRARDEDQPAARPGRDPRRGQARRRLRRHRRHLLERADGDAELSRRTSRRARATTGRTPCRWPRRSRTRAPAGAKVLALTVLDLLTRPELVTQAWDYFNNVQTKDKKYMPLLRPEDKPAIWLNKETMERYRPEMKKYYYDPTKYKTYLEQLGIKYPTTEKPQRGAEVGQVGK